MDYTLELIDGNRHLVPRNPKTTVCPSRMWVEQSGLFERNRMLGKQAAATDRERQRRGALVWVISRPGMLGRFMNNEFERMWKEAVLI